jgi:pectin lyase
VSLINNYIHQTSGRSPKLGGDSIIHAANNYFYNNSGHNFNPTDDSFTVAEGNYMDSCTTPVMISDTKGSIYAETSTGSTCKSYLGRACVANTNVNSANALKTQSGSAALTKVATTAKAYTPNAASRFTLATNNFGVGNL